MKAVTLAYWFFCGMGDPEPESAVKLRIPPTGSRWGSQSLEPRSHEVSNRAVEAVKN